ncbi:MAG: NTP transferase domain-containing protein [Candidatus Hydrogenedens sp.]|nr:NTP transferase domain-containing protein [Candidatus Hydrogenedens sp.]
MKLVALVPARGGSKGIPGKNIRPFCGKPLLYWVCRAAEDCDTIAETYVATDDEAIAAAVRALGLSKVRVIARAPETATDAASTESVLLDFAQRVEFTHLALLQATSPLLTSNDLAQGCARVLEGQCDSAFSAVRQKRFRWTAQPDGSAIPENYDPQHRPRRQDYDGFLVENGAFYVTSHERLLESRCRMSGRIEAIEMPEDTYFELDDLFDWTIMEGLMRRREQVARGDLQARIRGLRLVASDVDGCLTDSGMYYGEQGDELKKFSTRDGMGFRLLQEAGFDTAIITLENTQLMQRRAAKMKVPELHQGAEDKVSVMTAMLAPRDYSWEHVAYLGDDIGDIELLKRAGVSACPADAIPAVRSIVDIVLDTPGGSGAFREFAELILAGAR